MITVILSSVCLAACKPAATGNQAAGNSAVPDSPTKLSLTRLDCGSITVKQFAKSFSDKPGLYESGSRELTDSCYLIRHGNQMMLWDTGLWPGLIGHPVDAGPMVFKLEASLVDQLARIGVKPAHISIVAASHYHEDHTGQAASFPAARLIIGAADFAKASGTPQQGGPSPITPWLKDGANVTKASADLDIFGDGSVVALHLPGHTPDHMALLINLKSGPVMLSGDLYHGAEARQKRGVPPFNTSREQTLTSMDAFEAKAKILNAKVIVQHELADVAKLPAFPKAAE